MLKCPEISFNNRSKGIAKIWYGQIYTYCRLWVMIIIKDCAINMHICSINKAAFTLPLPVSRCKVRYYALIIYVLVIFFSFLYCVLLCFVVLCLVYPMLLVSLDCQHLIALRFSLIFINIDNLSYQYGICSLFIYSSPVCNYWPMAYHHSTHSIIYIKYPILDRYTHSVCGVLVSISHQLIYLRRLHLHVHQITMM